MKLSTFTSLSCAAVAVTAALSWPAWHSQHAMASEPPDDTHTTRLGPDQLRYPPGSPQLAYLSIHALKSVPTPLMEPLPARVALDEDHAVRVFSPIAGRTAQILVEPGQTVQAGQVLAWLLAPDYDTAIADLRKAQADHESKHAAFTRAQRLHEAGVIATRDLEAAQADARAAAAEMERASARVHALGTVGPDGRFALRAPIAGAVVERHLNPGQEIRPDANDPAFIIADLSHLDVVADVAETDIGKLHPGQTVRVQADGIDAEVQGRIATVGMAMDPSTRRIPVRAHLLNPPTSLRPEMFVRLSPIGDAAEPAIAVPNSAIVTLGQQSFVFVERSPGLLVKTHVEFARRGRDLSYVSSGLPDQARVVTKGAILLDAELASDN